MVVELCNAAALQAELGGAKFRTLDHGHLLRQPLPELQDGAFHAPSPELAKQSVACAVPKKNRGRVTSNEPLETSHELVHPGLASAPHKKIDLSDLEANVIGP